MVLEEQALISIWASFLCLPGILCSHDLSIQQYGHSIFNYPMTLATDTLTERMVKAKGTIWLYSN